MPIIKFVKLYAKIEVPAGANLMQSLLQKEMPVASSCHGEGICSKCQVQVISGNENLSPPTTAENRLQKQLSLPPQTRISCQIQVLGDIEIDTPYW